MHLSSSPAMLVHAVLRLGRRAVFVLVAVSLTASFVAPYAQRSISHRTPVFEITLAPGEQRTLYLRASSQGSMTLSGNLMNLADFERHSQVSYIAHALYCGVLVALGLYNLLLFLALRERPFLNYVLFMFAFALSVLSLNGLGAQYLWSEAAPWSNRMLPVSLTSMISARPLKI